MGAHAIDHHVVAATADLAERLGVGGDAIAVVLVEDVTWRDGGLGCPDPEMRYTQALVSGRRIVLEHGGRRYHYHSGGRRGPFLCETPDDPLDYEPRRSTPI